MTENSTSADDGPAEQVSATQEPAQYEPTRQQPAERSAGFLLYTNKGGKRRYLLLRHRYGAHWGAPKGHIEAGENEMEAALRETREETGFADIEPVRGFRAVSRYHFTRDHRTVFKEAIYFLGRVTLADPKLSREHTDAKWLPYSTAVETISYPDIRAILMRAEEWLNHRSTD